MPKASAVVMVSAVSGVPAAAVVLTAIDVSGVPAVARIPAVAAIPTAVDVPSAIGDSHGRRNFKDTNPLMSFSLVILFGVVK